MTLLLVLVLGFFGVHGFTVQSLALEQFARCGMEDHVHGAECYSNNNLVCVKTEHTHSENCYLVLLKDNANVKDGNDKIYANADDTVGTLVVASVLRSAPVVKNGENYTGGNFFVRGLDSVTYELEEITAPSGYNKMLESVPATISFVKTGDEITSLKCIADGGTYDTATDATNGAANFNIGMVKATINNTPGSTLPATGGIGTTIFYIVGAVLLIGSSVIFIMKKRNEA